MSLETQLIGGGCSRGQRVTLTAELLVLLETVAPGRREHVGVFSESNRSRKR